MIIDEMTKKQGGIYKEKNKVVKKKSKFWQIWSILVEHLVRLVNSI